MHNGAAVRSWQSRKFFSPKGFFVELDGLASVLYNQVRGQCVKTFWNGLDSICHFSFLFSFSVQLISSGSSSDERNPASRTIFAENFFAPPDDSDREFQARLSN